MLGFITTQKLKYKLGARSEYDNFWFDTLRHLGEKVSGRTPVEYFRGELFRPSKVEGFEVSAFDTYYGELLTQRGAKPAARPPGSKRPPLVWNATGGGPVSASAPALCAFMHRFWLSGQPRNNDRQEWRMDGSFDNSTAMMMWRSDGIDIAFSFNKGGGNHGDIIKDLESVIDKLRR